MSEVPTSKNSSKHLFRLIFRQMSDLIQIDGSFGEGGGQIVRTSVSLAVMTGRSVEIQNVRGRRAKPGLQAQHLASVRAAATLCAAQLSGDSVGSQLLRFEPQCPVIAGDYHFAIGTAGAAPLVVQTVLLPLALASGASNVRVTGGTHVPHAPTAEYLETVYVPTLQNSGLDIDFAYSSAGFFPKAAEKSPCELADVARFLPLIGASAGD